jgi:23S rRNA-/tRNA-specific pseudouridylate synthase
MGRRGERPTGEDELIAAGEDAGLRLDAFLAAHGATPSRAAAQRLIERGAVTVDGRLRPKNHRIAAGERISVGAPEEPEPGARSAAVDLRIVFKDEHLLVVDKPAGRRWRRCSPARPLAGRTPSGPGSSTDSIGTRLGC